jgi:hypothetical protein
LTQHSPATVAADRARSLLDVRRYRDACDAAWDGLRSEPNNAHLMGLVAAALQADNRSPEARYWAERSLAFDPQQAWVHNVRAKAILDGAGSPREAVESAYAAVQIDQFSDSSRFTLVRAYLDAGLRADAEAVARSIRSIDPNSVLGPLAEANVELDRVRTFQLRPVWAVVAVVVTQGAALVFWGIWWLVVAAWRAGPLRRADKLVLEALRLDPGQAGTHALAAEIAKIRFRYVQAVDAALATAAIDAGLVNADELAGRIVHRTCLGAVAAYVFWLVSTSILFGTAPAHVAAIVGLVVGLAGVGGVAWLDRTQTRRLPAGLLRRVRRRWELPATASVLASLTIVGGIAALGSSTGFAAAALVSGIAAAGCAAVLGARLYSARRWS